MKDPDNEGGKITIQETKKKIYKKSQQIPSPKGQTTTTTTKPNTSPTTSNSSTAGAVAPT